MNRAFWTPLARLKRAFFPRVSRARTTRFCAIVFGLALPAAIGMAIAGHESLKRRPAEFLSVAADPQSRGVLVTYRSRDGRVLTRAIGRKKSLTDDRGVTLCLRDFHRGALPFGPIANALQASGDSRRACAAR